jgi:uncharacterized protein YpmS
MNFSWKFWLILGLIILALAVIFILMLFYAAYIITLWNEKDMNFVKRKGDSNERDISGR